MISLFRTALAVCGLLVISFAVAIGPAHAAVVAHWSFDTPALTLDGTGNITAVAEQTGNHNATLGSGLGSGTGNPYTSNPIPSTNSIAGKFGQGLTLTGLNTLAAGGGQFLKFPELTEIMAGSGAPPYTVSYWINTTTTNANQFTVLGDWGNSAATPGRFAYGFGFQFTSGAAQMRGQSRFDNASAGGSDIFARATNAAALNNGSWHMLTWTFDPATAVLTSYFDGASVDTFTSAATSKSMVTASSAFGTFGLKGDSGNFLNGTISLDEAWVFNQVLTAGEVSNLFNSNNIAVPEPTALTLAGLGALAFCAWTLRRRK